MPSPSAAQLVKDLSESIRGKTVLVLGASPNSYGHGFLKVISAAGPSQFIVGARSPDKVPKDFTVPTDVFSIDMMSFKSVHTAADHVRSLGRIDVLVNSIGTMCAPWKKSEDGWESQLQSNHLGFFLFTNLLMDKLLKDKTRIVNVTSEGYTMGTGVRALDPNFHDGDVYNPGWAYGQAKTAQILFSAALARRHGDRITAFSIQPGYTQGTNLHSSWGDYTMEEFGKEFQKLGLVAPGSPPPPPGTLDSALANYVVAAFDPSVNGNNGGYIRAAEVVDPATMRPWAVGEVQEKICWDLSEKWVGQKFT